MTEKFPEERGKMLVKKWIKYNSDRPEIIGGLGGWFDYGMRWEDYLDSLLDFKKPYAEALRKDILEKKIVHNGFWHQYDEGTIGSFSIRAWHDLIAAIWSTKENKDYSYMDFAWSLPKGKALRKEHTCDQFMAFMDGMHDCFKDLGYGAWRQAMQDAVDGENGWNEQNDDDLDGYEAFMFWGRRNDIF